MGNRAVAMAAKNSCHPRHVSIELAMINGDYFWLLGVKGKKIKIESGGWKAVSSSTCFFALQSSGEFNLS